MKTRQAAWAGLLLLAACGGGDDGTGDAPASGTAAVTVTARVPANAPTVYISGNVPALGPWNPAGMAMAGEGAERTATLEIPVGARFEFKFTLGSWDREGLGPSSTVMPNFVVVVEGDTAVTRDVNGFKLDPREYMADPEGSGVLGTLVYWPEVTSAFLEEPRHVEIWLPPGYGDDPARRYRVLYMSDGQNLFDPRLASPWGDWGVDEAVVAGVEAGAWEAPIVVGVFNSSRRLQEYSPWHDAPDYARFLVEELIPRVNAEYRTLTGPENTFHMGSSMGGLLSYYLVKEHPDAFGACGCVSSHFPLTRTMAASITGEPTDGDETPYLLQDIAAGDTVPRGVRFFFDHGTEGLDASYAPTHAALREWLLGQGLTEGEEFLVRAYPGADHNEASWRARLGDQLLWILAGEVPPAP